jgi:diaminopimelate epimerase
MFRKMHGLGNDFVIIDARKDGPAIDADAAKRVADRRRGVGADQVILIEPPHNGGTAFMRIFNPDGSQAQACGNATRCVADLLIADGTERPVVETLAGALDCWPAGDGLITVDMGPARFAWRDIPLARVVEDTLHLPVRLDGVETPVGVSMGNPHCVFFVEDVAAIGLDRLGPVVEHHDLFPERTNVEIAQVLGPDHVRMRVWERGAGITLACGSGAAAVAAAAVARGLTQRRIALDLDGGRLFLEVRENGHVLMTGPTAHAFTGTLDAALLGEG